MTPLSECGERGALAEVLEQVALARIPVAEKRRLMTRAVETAMHPPPCRRQGPAEDGRDAGPFEILETSLLLVGKALGSQDKATVAQAKAWLREKIGPLEDAHLQAGSGASLSAGTAARTPMLTSARPCRT